jgi:hypothetical protein
MTKSCHQSGASPRISFAAHVLYRAPQSFEIKGLSKAEVRSGVCCTDQPVEPVPTCGRIIGNTVKQGF